MNLRDRINALQNTGNTWVLLLEGPFLDPTIQKLKTVMTSGYKYFDGVTGEWSMEHILEKTNPDGTTDFRITQIYVNTSSIPIDFSKGIDDIINELLFDFLL